MLIHPPRLQPPESFLTVRTLGVQENLRCTSCSSSNNNRKENDNSTSILFGVTKQNFHEFLANYLKLFLPEVVFDPYYIWMSPQNMKQCKSPGRSILHR